MLASIDLLEIIGTFDVHQFTSLSNHKPLSCNLYTCFNTKNIDQCQLDPLPDKFLWSVDALENYEQNIHSRENLSKLDEYVKTDYTDINCAVNDFNSILYENAKKSAKLVKRIPFKNKKRITKRKPWFSDSCRELRLTVKNSEKLVNKFLCNTEYRKKYSFKSR